MTAEGRPRRTDPARRGSAAARSTPGSSPEADIEITLRAMRFHARVGILDHERTLPQPIDVDLTVWHAPSDGVLDYRRLYEAAETVLGGEPIDYLEDVANQIAERVLSDGRIRRLRVAVRKPHVALPGPLAHAEVVLTRRNAGAR